MNRTCWTKNQLLRLVVAGAAVLPLASCDDETEASSASATGDGGEGSAGPTCIDGEIGCACADGELCEAGLVCMAGVCEEPGADETGDGTGGGAGSGGGVDACVDDVECDVSEVCVFETCTPIDVVGWEFAVVGFVPNACRDGWGSAEIFVDYYQDESLVWSSPTDGCPSAWPDDYQPYTPYSTFRLTFMELDAFFDDLITSWCWPDPLDEAACGPVPFEVLHERGFVGVSQNGLHSFEIVFEPVID